MISLEFMPALRASLDIAHWLLSIAHFLVDKKVLSIGEVVSVVDRFFYHENFLMDLLQFVPLFVLKQKVTA